MTLKFRSWLVIERHKKCSGVKLVKCSFRKMSLVTEMRHCNRLCFYIDHY